MIMYADNITDSMRRAIEETDRRRAIQVTYNNEHNITPAFSNSRSFAAVFICFLDLADHLIQFAMRQVFRRNLRMRSAAFCSATCALTRSVRSRTCLTMMAGVMLCSVLYAT